MAAALRLVLTGVVACLVVVAGCSSGQSARDGAVPGEPGETAAGGDEAEVPGPGGGPGAPGRGDDGAGDAAGTPGARDASGAPGDVGAPEPPGAVDTAEAPGPGDAPEAPVGGDVAEVSDPADVAEPSGQADAPDPPGPDAGGEGPDAPVLAPPGPEDEEFQAFYAAVLAEAKEMTVEQFVALYATPDLPVEFPLSYDPTASEYFALVDAQLGLTEAEKAGIKAHGFVVTDRFWFKSFGEALLHIFQEDLPVLVTSDMILHALHASYDDVLMELEGVFLMKAIDEILESTHAALSAIDVGADPKAELARQDADLFLAVARSLLGGGVVPTVSGGQVDASVAELLAFIEAKKLTEHVLYGALRTTDFSQFEPRGHYENIPKLRRYFQAMIWLGRADFRFIEPLPLQQKLDVRQLAAAHILTQALELGGGATLWQKADSLLRVLVGDIDYITPSGIQKLATAHGFETASAITAMDAAGIAAVSGELLGGEYGEQLINSHWLETGPFSSEPTPLPPAFTFFGQRFVVDSYIFANVVYDTVVYQGKKVPRVLPNPLDVLFALGNDQVVPHLLPELQTVPYQGNLHALRSLIGYYDADFWSGSTYNLWLSAIRTLNLPTTQDMYPEPMRTPAWRDKTLNTQLGSWAQLRHDTLLYAKQSYTGGAACSYPDGFVEPYPELYATLETLADISAGALAAAADGTPWSTAKLVAFFETWRKHMATLRSIAETELAKEPLSPEQMDFLKNTIMDSLMGCVPVPTGWYVDLFYGGPDRAMKYDPTIADVHTNPKQGFPLPGPNVLHVGTGQPDLLILTADTCDGPETYVGPVFSYYEVDIKEMKRLTDSDWSKMLGTKPQPPRPAWTQSYLVPAAK